jgi:hypothetical protein
MSNYLFLLVILACPLMMVFMHRGHRGHNQGHTGGQGPGDSSVSIDELRRRRERLDGEIDQRVGEERTRVGGDGR